MNALARYLSKTGESASAFASRMGRTASTITRLLKAERNPSPTLAIDIERATGGRVKATEIMEIGIERAERASQLGAAD